jgi:O-antigen ligase
MEPSNYLTPAESHQAARWPSTTGALSHRQVQLILLVLVSVGSGLAVIASTHFADNVKLLVGLVGAPAYVLVVMRWPEFGILGLVALLSGLISVTWLPLLHLGPASLNISDIVLLLLLSLVFLRSTTQTRFRIFGSPLLLPLLLFIGAFLLSAAHAILLNGVGVNTVLRTVRVLILWTMFIPTLQLVRDEQALRRLLVGILIFTGILLIGIVFPNKFGPFLPVEETSAATGATVYSGFKRFYYAGDIVLYSMIPITVASLAMIKKGSQLWRLLLLSLLLFWLFKTLFRQYWLTIFIICALLFVFFFTTVERMRLLKRLLPMAVGAVVVLAVLTVVQPTRVERIAYIAADRAGSLLKDPVKREASLQWRVIETHYAIMQITRHPVFGIGIANSYRPPMAGESETDSYSNWTNKYIENGYLWIAVMMGLVGLVPFLWLCAAYLFRVVRHWREIRDDGLRAVYVGLWAAFLGMVACNIATPTFVIGTRLIFFPLSMAISEAILRLERRKTVHQ